MLFRSAALWGVAAAVLPLVVRGRRTAVDAVAAAAWALSLVAATPVVTEALGGDAPSGTVFGAVLGAALAVAARAAGSRA